MKVVIVGASGKIGREVDRALSSDNEIVRVGATSGDYQCDFTSNESIVKMFKEMYCADVSASLIPKVTDVIIE